MPKRRNNAWSLRKKQKQIITSRLIEISLKVDEYVYNRKPISNTEAEQLIKEVESYKTTCIRDERSLQVIEKLTRCMKAIILEHEKSDTHFMDDADTCYLGENRPDSVSPVYSMCDEDLTQFSQTIDETGVNECDEIINLCIDDDDNSKNTASEDFIRPCPVPVEVDIHRAVSNLSLQEVPISEEETCSQSILNNFDDQMQQIPKTTPAKTILNLSIAKDDQGKITNETNHLPDKTSNKIIKVPALIMRPSKMFKPVTSKSLGDTIARLQEDSRVLKPVPYNDNNFNTCNQTNMSDPVPNKVMDHQERSEQVANNKFTVEKSKVNYSHSILSQNNAVEDTNSSNTTVHHFEPNFCGLNNSGPTNKTNQILDKGKLINNTSSIPGNTTETKKKRAPRKQKNVETKENKTKKSPVKKKSNRNSKLPTSEPSQNSFDLVNINPKIPIYNDRVINDLSWMENIRFVREIKLDENDQTLNLEESFWDNYHLPDSWNDNEFL